MSEPSEKSLEKAIDILFDTDHPRVYAVALALDQHGQEMYRKGVSDSEKIARSFHHFFSDNSMQPDPLANEIAEKIRELLK